MNLTTATTTRSPTPKPKHAQPHTPRDRSSDIDKLKTRHREKERERERDRETETQSCEARFAMFLAGRFPLPKSSTCGLAQSLGHGYGVHGFGFLVRGCSLQRWGAGVLQSSLHVFCCMDMHPPPPPERARKPQSFAVSLASKTRCEYRRMW